MRELDEFEHESLEAFALAHHRQKDRTQGCRSWREELSMVYWYNARIWQGPVPGMGSVLHGIRNEFGPTWLYDEYKPRKLPWVVVDLESAKAGHKLKIVYRAMTESKCVEWIGKQDADKVYRGGYGIDGPEQ
jgi:hypothetical protein